MAMGKISEGKGTNITEIRALSDITNNNKADAIQMDEKQTSTIAKGVVVDDVKKIIPKKRKTKERRESLKRKRSDVQKENKAEGSKTKCVVISNESLKIPITHILNERANCEPCEVPEKQRDTENVKGINVKKTENNDDKDTSSTSCIATLVSKPYNNCTTQAVSEEKTNKESVVDKRVSAKLARKRRNERRNKKKNAGHIDDSEKKMWDKFFDEIRKIKNDNDKRHNETQTILRTLLGNWTQWQNTPRNELNASTLGTAKVGLVRECNNEMLMDIGQDIWISKKQYTNSVTNAGNSNSKFVKNIALAVFSIDELKTSSITGTGCRRTGAAPKPAFDSIRLLAIKDIYQFFLRSERNLSVEEIAEELMDYTGYIRSKMQDLNKKKKTNEVPKVRNEKDNDEDVGNALGTPDKSSELGKSDDSISSNDSSSYESDNCDSNEKEANDKDV
ncbi:uncharacterized protein [Linepithema humile]|uniref:uncharacterized protein isoform X3 n=2 Tax=Linepithema humile TaxID=83485 RepID=UPI00351F42BC